MQTGHDITLLARGEHFFAALIDAVQSARHEVWLETYMFEFDRSGVRVAEALMAAARRGVAVRLVLDGYGTGRVPEEWQQRLMGSGVLLRVFQPVSWWSLFYLANWRRLHRKLVLIDGETAFCGGINVIDDFEDPHLGHLQHPRLDYAVRVRGPLVARVRTTMARLWWRLQVWQSMREGEFAAARHAALLAALPRKDQATVAPRPVNLQRTLRATLLLRDSLQHRNQIERAYLRAIGGAQREIVIANAYFIPGHRLRNALRHAARRGVKVQLLLQGQYEGFMQYHASRAVYGSLLDAGVAITEYRASHLHGKVAVVDGHWATVGSSNLDPISLLLAREANIAIEDPEFAQGLRANVLAAMAEGGVPMEPKAFAQRPWYAHLADWAALSAARILVAMSGQRFR